MLLLRGSHKHVVSPYNQFQGGWHIANSVICFLHVKIVILLGIHSQLQAYGTRDASEIMQCFANGRTSMPTCLSVDNTAGFTGALTVRDRYITLESSFMLDSLHSIVHDNLDYRKMCV